MDNNIFYGLCAAAGILFLAIIAVCYQCRKTQPKIKHVNQNSEQGTASQGSSEEGKEMEKAVQLEVVDMVDDEEKSIQKDQSLSREAALYNTQNPNLNHTKMAKISY